MRNDLLRQIGEVPRLAKEIGFVGGEQVDGLLALGGVLPQMVQVIGESRQPERVQPL